MAKKRIAPHFKDDLLSRADIVNVINSRVPLKKAGKDYQACCPFHEEKTPSFTVSAQKQFYYCFGCGAKGNAISFLMDYEHLQYTDAIEKLAEETGMTVEYEQLSAASVAKAKRQRTLQDVLEDTAALYEKNLYDTRVGQEARAYLQSRQLDKETTAFFRLGYSQGGNRLAGHFGREVSSDELQKAGLQARGDNGFYDFFRERLMFPIRDARGRVLGFGARALGDAKPKYLNTGDTEVFNKSNVLYGLYEELQTNRNIEHLIVVEGYMDVIALHQMGVVGAVAALGTAFTAGHLNLVRRYSKKLFICFDGDNAGRQAAQRAMTTILPAMTLDTKIHMVFLPEGEDPDTMVRKIGKAAFLEKLNQGQPLSEFVYDSLIADSDMSFVEGRGEVAQRAKTLFDELPDSEYKTILYQGLTERVGMDVYQLTQKIGDSEHHQPVAQYPQRRPAVRRLVGGAEARLIRFLLAQPTLATYVMHSQVLQCNDSQDGALLYHLILFLQNSVVFDGKSLPMIFQAFEQDEKNRLLYIYKNEKLPGDSDNQDTVSHRELDLSNEFIDGMQMLLNDCLRKVYWRT